MFAKGINWNDMPTYKKRGACIIKETYDKEGTMRTRWVVDIETPTFKENKGYIEKSLIRG